MTDPIIPDSKLGSMVDKLYDAAPAITLQRELSERSFSRLRMDDLPEALTKGRQTEDFQTGAQIDNDFI